MPAKAFCDICDNEIDSQAEVNMIVAGGIGSLGEDVALSMLCPGCYSDLLSVIHGRVEEIAGQTTPALTLLGEAEDADPELH